MLTKKSKSGLVAGTAAITVLLAMSLNIGGLDNFFSIVTGFGLIFLAVAMAAFILGFFISQIRLRWIAFAGAVIGLLSGFWIVISVVSGI
jgi:hypothetical protein